MDLNVTGIDVEKAEKGTWVDYSPGIRFRIARMNNDAYAAALKKVWNSHKSLIEAGALTKAQEDKLLSDVQAEFILTDWEGLTDRGQPFPYTVDNAKRLLSDKRYVELRNWIVEQANNIENYREEQLKKPQEGLSDSCAGS